ncbi:MAG: hypothetical protein QF844_04870 [Acidimicrobiales bacterium]|nr:hypothetical protein [Acidimicrobiales bacterium]
MRKRLVWLIGGWVVGTLSAAWIRRRVRQGVRRYAPARLRHEVSDRSSAVVDGIRRIAREVAAAGRDSGSGFRTGDPYAQESTSRHRRHRRPVRSVPGDR